MNPFEGQRRLEVRAEQVVWHLVSAGVLGLLVMLLLFSVALLDGASPTGASPEAAPKIARPIDEAPSAPAVLETSMQHDERRPGAHRLGGGEASERVRVRAPSRQTPEADERPSRRV